MTRRRSHVSIYGQIQCEGVRTQVAQARAQAAARREAERARAAYLRAQAADEKERKRLYTESRVAEVAARNDDLGAAVVPLRITQSCRDLLISGFGIHGSPRQVWRPSNLEG
jgi:restriction system protein